VCVGGRLELAGAPVPLRTSSTKAVLLVFVASETVSVTTTRPAWPAAGVTCTVLPHVVPPSTMFATGNNVLFDVVALSVSELSRLSVSRIMTGSGPYDEPAAIVSPGTAWIKRGLCIGTHVGVVRA